MTKRDNRRYTFLQTEDTDAARLWLCDRLFFTQADNGDLINGDCILRLVRRSAMPMGTPPENAYYCGLAHVALAAADIDEALDCCKARGLCLQTDGGASFFNPKVFGQGERYFNVLSPFGAVFEVAQRIGAPRGREVSTPVFGLDHLGLPCANLDTALVELGTNGFTPLFATVENLSAAEGRVRCCMFSDGSLTLEAYQFLDRTPLPMPRNAPLLGVGDYPVRSAPGGLRLIAKGEMP